MAIPKIEGAQRDFSAGELDVAVKRGDDTAVQKAGVRQMSNWRILNSRSVQNRPGRKVLFRTALLSRTEEITMSPGNIFFISFSASTCKIYDPVGTLVFNSPSFAWTQSNLNQIVYAVYRRSIYITFPGQIPKVISWDGAATWSLADYAEMVTPGNQKRTFFYRFALASVTMQPDGITGAVNLTFSGNVADPGMVGTRMRYVGRQIFITSYTGPTALVGLVQEPLPYSQTAVVAPNPANVFSVGDVVIGSISGARGLVAELVDPTHVNIQLVPLTTGSQSIPGFVATDRIVGPAGSVQASAITGAQPPRAVAIWDEEVINAFRGYPRSVFADQNRLGFCDFPGLPHAVGWSAIGLASDLYVDAQPTNAMLELAPDPVRVRYVLAGPESHEFVFCDNKIYYIPISFNNPLKPGSVAFNMISSDGCAAVQPRAVEETILFISSGSVAVRSITAVGAYQRPFESRDLTELHAHLIRSPIAIAVPTASGTFPERYAYVLNADGTVAVGKYNIDNGQIKGQVGWCPHSGAGTVSWVGALNASVIFSASYAPGAATVQFVVERLDDTLYLDIGTFVNNIPPALTPPGGMGPLWWLASGTTTLMDQSTRFMGTYSIDASGFIIPQNNGGENLASATLVAGQPWTATLEPFAASAAPGPNVQQRVIKRRMSRFAAYVANSTGFLIARFFSGPITRTSPALGTVMNQRRISTWNQDDDPTLPPPQREEVQRWRPLGRSFDPRVGIIKDTPGPLMVAEIDMEVSV